MSKDRAFRKILTGKPDDLPEVFEERVMNRILLEIERKSRRSYYLSLVLVFGISLVMIAGTYFVFHHFFSFDILDLFSDIHIRFEYNPFYTYCFYIAFLVLVLLGLDHKFRQIMKKTENR